MLVKRSVCTGAIYSNQPLSYFLSTFGVAISSNSGHRFMFYANSRDMIERYGEMYGGCLEKSNTLPSDYLKILGTMKKRGNSIWKILFCKDRKMGEDGEDMLNPLVLFVTSGAAKFGIDNDTIYCIFRAEISP